MVTIRNIKILELYLNLHLDQYPFVSRSKLLGKKKYKTSKHFSLGIPFLSPSPGVLGITAFSNLAF